MLLRFYSAHLSWKTLYVCTYIRMYVCMYVHMYVHMYIRMYVCMYVHMYVHMCPRKTVPRAFVAKILGLEKNFQHESCASTKALLVFIWTFYCISFRFLVIIKILKNFCRVLTY
jgi:hypothetical protein